eukprot:CAMPEP_0174376528 /NCGR_PEP_ID=MMETSP0811_2-20130205/118485_1 /TAXON_ID=73025 ORGANISM="Eutreptiella gymnastica-like, Strain CCMP1594" /NCGR_SAMPLE_ID=MMETSP0811_2 /ASSEMBLY_ACC=CAM_ASM_000667 /LENGTH=52 /DNA_ID=CAMNT_0015527781 /DNA_START=325 /DNA_END=480 /DNA_ORIENTATION=+
MRGQSEWGRHFGLLPPSSWSPPAATWCVRGTMPPGLSLLRAPCPGRSLAPPA